MQSPSPETDDPEANALPVADPPYSIFTQREKYFIVGLISLGGLFR